MKFAHLADVHVGAWRDHAMKDLMIDAFRAAVDRCIEERVEFVVIAGDLFNTAIPAIDHLQHSVVLLKRLKKAGIRVYAVPGSHDFNAAGKTILDVLEEADLLCNVMKASLDSGSLRLELTSDSSGALLAGIGGRRGGLESGEYKSLDVQSLESARGFKVFLFHSSIEELVRDEMGMLQSIKASELPAGFDYYAGGHVHIVKQLSLPKRPNIVYPGPIYPASFGELWKLRKGGFFIYDDGRLERVDIELKKVVSVDVDAEGRTPEEVSAQCLSGLDGVLKGSIVLLQVKGTLRSGKSSDVDFRSFFARAYAAGAHYVMRSTSKLVSPEMVLERSESASAEEIEEEVIAERAAGKSALGEREAHVMRSLIRSLSEEQRDGEKKYEYDERMKRQADEIFGL